MVTPDRHHLIDLRLWDQFHATWVSLLPVKGLRVTHRPDLSIDTMNISLPRAHPAAPMIREARRVPRPVTLTVNGVHWSGLISTAVEGRGKEGAETWELTVTSDDKHLHRMLARAPEVSALDNTATRITGRVGRVAGELVAAGAARTGLPTYVLVEDEGDMIDVEARTDDYIGSLLTEPLASSTTFATVRTLLPEHTLPGDTDVRYYSGRMERRWQTTHQDRWPHARTHERLQVGMVESPAVYQPPHAGYGHGQIDVTGRTIPAPVEGVVWEPFQVAAQGGTGYWGQRSEERAGEVRVASREELRSRVEGNPRLRYFGQFVTQWAAGTFGSEASRAALPACADAGLLWSVDGEQLTTQQAMDRYTGETWAWRDGTRWIVANTTEFHAEADDRMGASFEARQYPGLLVHLHGVRDRRHVVWSTAPGGGLQEWSTTITAPDGAMLVAAGQVDEATMKYLAEADVAATVGSLSVEDAAGMIGDRADDALAGVDGLDVDVQPNGRVAGSELTFSSIGGRTDIEAAGPLFFRERFHALTGAGAAQVPQLMRAWAEQQGDTSLTLTPVSGPVVFGDDITIDGRTIPGWRPGDRISLIDEGVRVSEVIAGYELSMDEDGKLTVRPLLGRRDAGVLAGLGERIRAAEQQAKKAALAPPRRIPEEEVTDAVDGIVSPYVEAARQHSEKSQEWSETSRGWSEDAEAHSADSLLHSEAARMASLRASAFSSSSASQSMLSQAWSQEAWEWSQKSLGHSDAAAAHSADSLLHSEAAEKYSRDAAGHSEDAQGYADLAAGDAAVAAGHSADSLGHSQAAAGHSATAEGHSTAAAGHSSDAAGHSVAAQGHSQAAAGHSSDAAGHSADAQAASSAAAGHSSTAKSHSDAAQEASSTAAGHSTTAAGHSADASAASGTASGHSSAAKSHSDVAAGHSTAAFGSAEEAETHRQAAESARGLAEAERSLAEQARDTAETARSGAETARSEAETARSGAESARSEAEAERSLAETARGEAEGHRSGAETARSLAEAERMAAENARDLAETARSLAEQERAAAENARDAAEQGRADAETQRMFAEQARSRAFAGMAQANAAMMIAEQSRAEAEAQRALAESARASAETERSLAEGARAEAENARSNAEAARSEAESARSAAETARSEAETARAEAEADRAAAEAARDAAEGSRSNAEAERMLAEQARQGAFEEWQKTEAEAAKIARDRFTLHENSMKWMSWTRQIRDYAFSTASGSTGHVSDSIDTGYIDVRLNTESGQGLSVISRPGWKGQWQVAWTDVDGAGNTLAGRPDGARLAAVQTAHEVTRTIRYAEVTVWPEYSSAPREWVVQVQQRNNAVPAFIASDTSLGNVTISGAPEQRANGAIIFGDPVIASHDVLANGALTESGTTIAAGVLIRPVTGEEDSMIVFTEDKGDLVWEPGAPLSGRQHLPIAARTLSRSTWTTLASWTGLDWPSARTAQISFDLKWREYNAITVSTYETRITRNGAVIAGPLTRNALGGMDTQFSLSASGQTSAGDVIRFEARCTPGFSSERRIRPSSAEIRWS